MGFTKYMDVSIVFGHYSEDKEREEIARRALKAVKSQLNSRMELIIVFNGLYPYRNEFTKHAHKWHERPADPLAGKTANIGFSMAKSNIVFLMSNDVLLHDGAISECVRLIKLYPKYLVSPVHPTPNKKKLNLPFGEYSTNKRSGDMAVFMTKDQLRDIGPYDEVSCWTDGINYINRRIAKGYTVILTKEPMAEDLASGIHSFKSQIKKYNMHGYKQNIPLYSKEELIKQSYGPLNTNTR